MENVLACQWELETPLQHDLADSTRTFHRILVTSAEINTVSFIDCCNVGGKNQNVNDLKGTTNPKGKR